MHDKTTQAAILAAIAQDPSPTALPPTFAGDPMGWAAWNFHTLAGEAVCDLGERAMRRRAPAVAGFDPASGQGCADCAAEMAAEDWAAAAVRATPLSALSRFVRARKPNRRPKVAALALSGAAAFAAARKAGQR